MMGKHAKMTTQTSEKSDLLSEQDATNLQEEQVNESAESVGADNVSDELSELQKKYD